MIFKQHLVIVIDGWSPLKPLEQNEIEDSDEGGETAPESEQKKEPELPKMTVYNC